MSLSFASRAASAAALMLLAVVVACSDSPITQPTETPVASVAVTPPAHSLVLGQQVGLQAKPKAADGQDLDRDVTWSSENEGLATVSSAGLVTTLAVGQVAIRATSEGKFGRAVITIQAVPPVPVSSVRLSVDSEVELQWNGSTQITAQALDADGNVLEGRPVEWQTNRASVATVEGGMITAVAVGTATITAVVEGVPASVGVRVMQAPVTDVFIDAVTTGMETGEVFLFGSRVKRANGETMYAPVSWTSSNPAVGRVDSQDLWSAGVAAVSEGTFTLSATAEGVSTSLTLTVVPRPAYDLVYNRWTDTESEIFMLDLQNFGISPVKVNAGNVSREPSPSPDGSQLVFAVSQRNQTTNEWQHDLFIVNRNGLNMRWLTRMAGLEEQPQWSPDGSKILFRGSVEGSGVDLYTINVDGTGLTNITESLPADMTDKMNPSWSFDNKQVVFIGVRGTTYKVWTVSAEGTNPKQITSDAGFDHHPAFSPDGERIAFSRYNATNNSLGYDVMFVPAEGGTPTRVALPGDQTNPAYSPDGKYIAVSGAPTAGTGRHEIHTMRADGTGLRLRTVNPAWGGGFNPAWIARP